MLEDVLIRAAIGKQPEDTSAPKVPIEPVNGALPLLVFKLRHRMYRKAYWDRLRALYAGGDELLGNLELLKQIIPRNNREDEGRYLERLRSAFYVPYAAEIIGYILAGLGEDPLRVTVGEDAAKAPEGFLSDFVKDTGDNPDDPADLNRLAHDVVLEALQVRTAWVLLEEPSSLAEDELEGMSQADLEESQDGDESRRIRARCIKAESVINWSQDKEGDLVWALTEECVEIREDFWSAPVLRYTWTLHTKVDQQRWQLDVDPRLPPSDQDMVQPLGEPTPHEWEMVPLFRFTLPSSLWAMDKLESLAREHTDKRNDLGRSVKRSANPILYEFLGPETGGIGRPIGQAQQDPNRAVNTPRSPMHVQRRGKEDDARYVAPPAEAYAAMLAYCHDVRDDMHRVMVQMALAADFKSASAIGRSGDSKAQDRASAAVINGAIGKKLRPSMLKLLRIVLKANSEDPDTVKPSIAGMAKFDATVVGEIVEQTQLLEGVTLPSPTAKAQIAMRLVRAVLDQIDAPTMDKIQKELEDGFNPETVLEQQVETAMALAVANAAGETDDEGDGDAGEDDAPPAKPARKGPVVDTEKKPTRRR